MLNYHFETNAEPYVKIVKPAERESVHKPAKLIGFEARVSEARQRKNERTARAWELHKQGKKQVEIAETIGVTRQVVAKYIKHMEDLNANQN